MKLNKKNILFLAILLLSDIKIFSLEYLNTAERYTAVKHYAEWTFGEDEKYFKCTIIMYGKYSYSIYKDSASSFARLKMIINCLNYIIKIEKGIIDNNLDKALVVITRVFDFINNNLKNFNDENSFEEIFVKKLNNYFIETNLPTREEISNQIINIIDQGNSKENYKKLFYKSIELEKFFIDFSAKEEQKHFIKYIPTNFKIENKQ